MKSVLGLALVTLLLGAVHASAASITYDFEDGTDQGFGAKFSNDASKSFPIVSIGGSKRMEVARTGAFQEADRGSAADAGFAALDAAINNPSAYTISYDWYVDTSLAPGSYGNFLQIGSYVNSGAGGYVQNFGTPKEVELNGTQLASGSVFSGTVTQTVAAKYGALPATFLAQTFQRFGLILNGDGANAKVYFDNISIQPVPEPASLALAAIGIPALAFVARRRRK
jgi:PEP-CTERM motif-containing protein